jgi:uncharacterized coiled-coil DUF342 family protein
MLNNKHKENREKMKKIKEERDQLVNEMRNHKDLRNKLQKQAKELIDARRQRKGEVFKNLPLRVEELKADVQMLEYRQETIPMNPQQENELIDKIREKRIDFEKTKKLMEKQKEIEIDISDKDQTITDLFKKADEEHQMVQKYYQESQKKHNEYIEFVRELSISIGEANKKHEEYIEVKNEAQKNHEKAIDMRTKMISIKAEKRKRFDEARKAIQDQNIKARDAVLNKDKIDKIIDKTFNDLKQGKNIKL